MAKNASREIFSRFVPLLGVTELCILHSTEMRCGSNSLRVPMGLHVCLIASAVRELWTFHLLSAVVRCVPPKDADFYFLHVHVSKSHWGFV